MKHNIKPDSLDGEWSGYLLFYDWSGKHKLNETEVSISFQQKGDSFEGNWTQEGTTFGINGFNNKYGIVFNSGEFDYADHYMGEVRLKINTGSFESFTQGGKSILIGNISLFSVTERAPERPACIVLIKAKKEKKEKNGYYSAGKLTRNCL